MRWKTAVIWTLAALNGLLLLGVVLGAASERAYAQGAAGSRSYVLIPTRYQTGDEALWVIDQASRKMALYTVDNSRGILSALDGRDLDKDFRSRTGETP
jgi:hypothetical protein